MSDIEKPKKTTDLEDETKNDSENQDQPDNKRPEEGNPAQTTEQSKELALPELPPVETSGPDDRRLRHQLIHTVSGDTSYGNSVAHNSVHGALALYTALKPEDAQDSILARLAVAGASIAMDAGAKAAASVDISWAFEKHTRLYAQAALTTVKIIESYDKRRGQQKQTVQVRDVTVQSGAQAIVGTVNRSTSKESDTKPALPPARKPDDEDEE